MGDPTDSLHSPSGLSGGPRRIGSSTGSPSKTPSTSSSSTKAERALFSWPYCASFFVVVPPSPARSCRPESSHMIEHYEMQSDRHFVTSSSLSAPSPGAKRSRARSGAQSSVCTHARMGSSRRPVGINVRTHKVA